jgi:hypothetical protein
VGLTAFNHSKSKITDYLQDVTLHIGLGSYEVNLCVVEDAAVPYLLAGDFLMDYDVQPKYDRKKVALGVANPICPPKEVPSSWYQVVDMQVGTMTQRWSMGPPPQ